jgi:phage tail-like protein
MPERDAEYLGSSFALELDGVTIAMFTGCSGLSITTEVVELKTTTPDGKLVIQKRPGRTSYDDIVLKRAISADKALTDWHKTVQDGSPQRKNGSIVIYSETFTEIGRWNFENGWPSKWSGGDMSADSDDLMIEELTISHELLARA